MTESQVTKNFEPFDLEFACTAKELKEAQSAQLADQKSAWQQWLLVVFVLAMMGVALWGMILRIPAPFRVWAIFGFVIFVVGFMYFQDRRQKKAFENVQPCRATVEKSGVTYRSDLGESNANEST